MAANTASAGGSALFGADGTGAAAIDARPIVVVDKSREWRSRSRQACPGSASFARGARSSLMFDAAAEAQRNQPGAMRRRLRARRDQRQSGRRAAIVDDDEACEKV